MASIPLPQDTGMSSLPQYGFAADVDFDSLIKDNHFLFRVYTPRERSPFFDDTDPFFIAPRFNERYNLSPEEFNERQAHRGDVPSYVGTYDDVAKHMEWTTRSSSPYITTSFSFIWAIWEALRRYHQGVKKDVQIAVIDASALCGRAATAVQLLRMSSPSERRSDYWKWYRFSQESQSVLVYESIPCVAVLASIPLLSLLEKLPSYFLRPEVSLTSKDSALAAVAWDYAERKRSYRTFCQNMSARFLQLSPEVRLQDTTAGSVRLAMAFLRPWFHQHVTDDFQAATVTLCALSFSIAQWPGQWWAQEHSEMWNLIRVMSLSLAEEVREKQQGQVSAEVNRLQEVIHGLEGAVKNYKEVLSKRGTKKSARLLAPLTIPPPLKPAILPISPSPFTLAPAYNFSTPTQRSVVPTPITPPTSPIRSAAPAFPSNKAVTPTKEPGVILSTSLESALPTVLSNAPSTPTVRDLLSLISEPTLADSPPPTPRLKRPMPLSLDMNHNSSAESPDEPHKTGVLEHESLPTPAASLKELSPIEPPTDEVAPVEKTTPPTSPDSPPAERSLPLEFLPPSHYSMVNLGPWSFPSGRVQEEGERIRRSQSVVETASCVVTGFLVGAFVTLCLLSPHRRTLLTNLT